MLFWNRPTRIHCISSMFPPSLSEYGVIGVLCSDQQGLALSGESVYKACVYRLTSHQNASKKKKEADIEEII